MTLPPRLARARLRLAVGLALGILALTLTAPAPAQEKKVRIKAEGTHVCRRILHDVGFEPLQSFDQLNEDPAHSLLVVLGDTRCLERDPGWLPDFVSQGGAVFLATDREMEGQARADLETLAGVRVNGQKLVGIPDICYRGKDFCPLVQPSLTGSPMLFVGVSTGGVRPLKVATNLPSFLEETRRSLLEGVSLLAYLPLGCATEEAVRGFGALTNRFTPPRPFAVSVTRDKGRALVLADHSLFINSMMLPDDNQNVEFTYNCMEWLRGEEGPGQRTRVLFVEEGGINTTLNVPMKEVALPEPTLEEVLATVNATLSRAEDQDAFNRMIQRWQEQHRLPPRRLAQGAALLLSLVFLLFCLHRVGVKGRYRPQPGVPLLARAVEDQRPALPLLEQRHEAMLGANNLWESARGLARQLFRTSPATAPLVARSPEDSARPPRLVVQGNLWQRRSLGRLFRRLWRLAYDPHPLRVPRAAWRRLVYDVHRLEAALAVGTVRPVGPGANGTGPGGV